MRDRFYLNDFIYVEGMNPYILKKMQLFSKISSVRILKVVLKDFKSVDYGEIQFDCGKQSGSFSGESDILGIYGQNGSGKTAFVEALAVLKCLMDGVGVSSVFADCVAVGSACAELAFTFAMYYSDGNYREAEYRFCMASKKLSPEEMSEKYRNAPRNYELPKEDFKVEIFNERFSLTWEKSAKKQLVIDTSPESAVFVPVAKRNELIGGDKKLLEEMRYYKRIARENSGSFIFNTKVLSLLESKNPESVFTSVLMQLQWYAGEYLYVVDTKSSGYIRFNNSIPVYTRHGLYVFDARRPARVKQETLADISEEICSISHVLSQLVPGLSIGIKEIYNTLDKNGEGYVAILLTASRDGKELPLRDESDGVRKIISVLALFIAVFNDQSVTVAIDEFDAGIFEYLLGELLEILQESGKGQFIFTSHNLRPLEVLYKKFVCFTTANPANRYIRLKKVGATNNLRDTYFRDILLGGQEEELYNRTKRYKIIAALKRAGDEY